MSKASKIGTYSGALLVGIPISITLEVLGGAGAIWGAGEVLTLRNEHTANPFRAIACTIGALSLISYCCRHSYTKVGATSHHGFFSAFCHAAATPWKAIVTEHYDAATLLPR